jgi:ketosteroid isomerase-like protein
MNDAAIVRTMFDTLNNEGTEAALAWFAEDFHGVVPPELSAEPDSYNGHDGVRRYFDSFHEIVADLRFDAEDLVEVAPGAVVARGLITGSGRESGIPIEMRVPLLVRLRDGELVELSAYAEWDEAVAAGSAAAQQRDQ